MKNRFGFILLVILITFSMQACSPPNEYIFPGVVGPDEKTVIPPPEKSSWENYAEGSNSRLAILLTEEDTLWLGLVNGLKSRGIPFVITDDLQKAVQHKVVLAYPFISRKNFSDKMALTVDQFVSNGGTFIASSVLSDYPSLFGFTESISTESHHQLHFTKAHPFGSFLSLPEELNLQLSNKITETPARTTSYFHIIDAEVIATYEDGLAAILQKKIGKGQTVTFGINLGLFFLAGYNNRLDIIKDTYVNRFIPTIDVFLEIIKSLYIQGEPDAVTLWTVPSGHSLSVIYSHDIDYMKSLKNGLIYAEFEVSHDIHATYFMQTKYMRDYNDEIFFDAEAIPLLQDLLRKGMEIGSHTVCHSKQFAEFPIGTGLEKYPEYQPFVVSPTKTINASILGELRVSKFLLETCVGDNLKVVSFRPGELANPLTLPQCLKSTDYFYSSSVTANSSWTHLPFQLNYGRDFINPIDIYEFPVTLEDEELPDLGSRVDAAILLAQKIRPYGGLYMILIHPNILDHKLQFAKDFYEAVKDYSWFGSLQEFASWWVARDHVQVDIHNDHEKRILQLSFAEPIHDLVIMLPEQWQLETASPDIVYEKGKLLIKKTEKSLRVVFLNQS